MLSLGSHLQMCTSRQAHLEGFDRGTPALCTGLEKEGKVAEGEAVEEGRGSSEAGEESEGREEGTRQEGFRW